MLTLNAKYRNRYDELVTLVHYDAGTDSYFGYYQDPTDNWIIPCRYNELGHYINANGTTNPGNFSNLIINPPGHDAFHALDARQKRLASLIVRGGYDANQKINAISGLRTVFPDLGLLEAKNWFEVIVPNWSDY